MDERCARDLSDFADEPARRVSRLVNARDSYLVFTVMAAFVEVPTDEVEFV
jgi:hypothetical protein